MYDYGNSKENKKHYGQVCFIKRGINRKARFLLHEVLKKTLLRAHKRSSRSETQRVLKIGLQGRGPILIGVGTFKINSKFSTITRLVIGD